MVPRSFQFVALLTGKLPDVGLRFSLVETGVYNILFVHLLGQILYYLVY
jgi:hypothetical protein